MPDWVFWLTLIAAPGICIAIPYYQINLQKKLIADFASNLGDPQMRELHSYRRAGKDFALEGSFRQKRVFVRSSASETNIIMQCPVSNLSGLAKAVLPNVLDYNLLWVPANSSWEAPEGAMMQIVAIAWNWDPKAPNTLPILEALYSVVQQCADSA
jgi:hypothetical protein